MRNDDMFQFREMPGGRWPAIPDQDLAQAWGAYQTLERTQWLSPEEIEQGQLSQARILLSHCATRVPYYHDLFKEHNIFPDGNIKTMDDFRRIPILKRSTYQEKFSFFLARSMPRGMFRMDELTTSGTTGEPIRVQLTNVTATWWLAFLLRDMKWGDINPMDTLASLRGVITTPNRARQAKAMTGIVDVSWGGDLGSLIKTGYSHSMDIRQTPEKQIEWLDRVEPRILVGYPSNIALLAAHLAERGRRVKNLHKIQTFAETLTDETAMLIANGFNAEILNLYSCNEAGYLASTCPGDGDMLHVHAENVIFEVLDDDDQPITEGTGRVVITALHNFCTPFIRYEIGDEVTLYRGPCDCERGLPTLTAVHGKTRPLFHLGDGNERKSPVELVQFMQKLDGVRQFQLVQREPGHLLVRIVPGPTLPADFEARIQGKAHRFFMTGRSHTEVEIVERLELTPRGKMREVVCEVEE